MSTRSLTVMTDNGKEIAVLYRQMDGYPTGHGQELVDFLKQFPTPLVGDGLGSYYDREGKKCWWCKSEKKEDERIIANGAECLFAQLVAHFKTTAGGFYLMAAGTRGQGTAYTYYVDVQGDIEIGDGSEDIYLSVAKSEGEEETFLTPMGRRTMEGWPESIIWEGTLDEYDSKSLEEEGWG